jgi:hypothetical protein
VAIAGILLATTASAETPLVGSGASLASGWPPAAAPLASGVPDLTGTWSGALRGRSHSLATTDKPARLALDARLTVTQIGGASSGSLNFGDGLPITGNTNLIQIGQAGSSGNRNLTGFGEGFGTSTLCTGRASRSQRKLVATCATITPDWSHRYKLKLRRE